MVLAGAGAMLFIASVSGRLDRLYLTEPLVAAALGVLLSLLFLDGALDLETPLVLTFLELTLALVLFTDASRINLTRLRDGYSWPLRMLVIGMPVVIVLGMVVSGALLGFSMGFALLLAVVLAPTDAALAGPVLESESVPDRVRQTINVESGLNDGLAVPALLLALALVESEGGATAGETTLLFISQLGIGVLGGVALGWLGAKLIDSGTEAGWMSHLHQKIAAAALALGGYALVQLLGGSGFVAVFIAGAFLSHLVRPKCEYLYEFAETEGHSLVTLAFLFVGAGPIAMLFREGLPSWEVFVVAGLSLAVLRPISIAVSLLGQRLNWRTVFFLGWFGPRGLATVVFVLLAIEELSEIPDLIVTTVAVVVAFSILAHGLSAVPMSRWLGSATESMEEEMPEMGEAYPHQMKGGVSP